MYHPQARCNNLISNNYTKPADKDVVTTYFTVWFVCLFCDLMGMILVSKLYIIAVNGVIIYHEHIVWICQNSTL